MNILIIEDTPQKADRIKDAILKQFPYHKVEVKGSYQSGIEAVVMNEYHLILLDMTIPMFDYEKEFDSANPEPTGGYKLLKELKRRGIKINVIIITQFSSFISKGQEEQDLYKFTQEMKEKFETLKGSIFYAQNNTAWETELIDYINKL
jgi:CheY-like chemotaxis protein